MARRLRLTTRVAGRVPGRVASPDAHAPVTTLELFFDLVFVLTVTQLTRLVGEPHGASGYLQALAMLWVVWWMYDGFAWLANNVGPTTASTRVPMLVAMAAFLVVAIALPDAFGDDRWLFAAGYLVLVLVHGFSFLRSSLGRSARAILSIAPINLGMCAGLFLAAALSGDVRWVGWALAVALPFVSLVGQVEGDFSIRPAHFAERHRLMLIIALGESVLAVGVSTQGHLTEPDHLLAVLLAMLLVALLWWLHFADDASMHRVDEVVERPAGVTARTALLGFSLGYLVLVAGLVLVAAGLHVVVPDPARRLDPRVSVTMAVGAATYLAGNVYYLHRLGVTGRGWLLVTAALSLATAPVGHWWGGTAQVVALDVVLLAALAPLVRDRVEASADAPGEG
jgi:low temperature requirement protein LtrA